MAKILPCYSLCPLIEQKSFLGLTEDAESDTVIVTANSNIIGRYRVSDPKQITSWNSKGSITCATIYDKQSQNYVGVFNQNELRTWGINEESIDKVKKYKFAEKIRGLVTSPEDGKTVIIFNKGNALYIDIALDKRKSSFESSCVQLKETICSYEILSIANGIVVSLLVKTDKSYRLIGVVPNETTELFHYQFQDNNKLLGYCLLSNKNLDCVSLWSDGKLCRNSLLHDSNKPLKHLYTFQDFDNDQPVALKTLSPYSIAICYLKNGGLMLLVYSVKYNLIQCRQFYENCANFPQLWYFDNKLFLIIGHNLVVVPYAQENRTLSTLVGTNTENLEDRNDDVLPESEICKKTVPQLLEENNTDGIRNLVESCRDIPDSIVIDILLWCMQKKKARRFILQTILLTYTITDISTLRNAVSVDASLELLEYVVNNISKHDNVKLVKWASVLVDAFYQQYMMSSDKNVLERLNSYMSILKKECDRLNDYMEIAATASCVKRKKLILSK